MRSTRGMMRSRKSASSFSCSTSSGRLVAVTRRKSLVRGGSDSRPSGVYWRSSSARMSRRWTSREMSPTSSRNKVSPWATESRPSLSLVAPVKEPALWPKSSDLMVSPLNWPQATEGQR